MIKYSGAKYFGKVKNGQKKCPKMKRENTLCKKH